MKDLDIQLKEAIRSNNEDEVEIIIKNISSEYIDNLDDNLTFTSFIDVINEFVYFALINNKKNIAKIIYFDELYSLINSIDLFNDDYLYNMKSYLIRNSIIQFYTTDLISFYDEIKGGDYCYNFFSDYDCIRDVVLFNIQNFDYILQFKDDIYNYNECINKAFESLIIMKDETKIQYMLKKIDLDIINDKNIRNMSVYLRKNKIEKIKQKIERIKIKV